MEQNNKSLSNFDAFKRLLTPFVADYPLLQMDQGGGKASFLWVWICLLSLLALSQI
ncbi:hypothetical protein CHELV3228_0422 [Campylobacter helveticus]|nr:hypothetical protein CHELV3228_0422 [Campylobacter helveticus]